MASPTTLLKGDLFLTTVGGDAIGCETGATPQVQRENRARACKSAPLWRTAVQGSYEWTIRTEALFEDGASPVAQAGSTVALTVGGVALKGIRQITWRLSADVQRAVNTTTGLGGVLDVGARFGEIDVEFDYYDPDGTGAGALKSALDEVLGSTSAGLAFVLTFGAGASFTFTARPSNVEINFNGGERVSGRFTAQSEGAITNGSANEDAGIGSLQDAFFGASGVTSLTALLSASTTDYTNWSGITYPTDITYTIPYDGDITIAVVLTGSGTLTMGNDTL